MDSKMLQVMIEDDLMEKKKEGKSRSTIQTTIQALELFSDANDVMINWKKIRRMLPPKKKRTGSKAYTTEHIAKMLEATTDLRNKAIIHFLASTGCRIGALPELRIKHIKNMPDGCKVVTIYPDDREEYLTFLTSEASTALENYFEKRQRDGEHLDPEHPVFRQIYSIGIAKPKPLVKVSIQAIVDRILRRAGLRFGRDGSRRDIQLDHGFRKRWNTIVKTTDGIKILLAEKMIGHSTSSIPLDETYLVASVEKLFEEFKKAIPELTVDGTTRDQIKLEQMEKENIRLNELVDKKLSEHDLILKQLMAKTQSVQQQSQD
jgi:integrase/recombinase XerD